MVEENGARKKKGYVLIVEKNVDDRFLTSMLLQRFGYNTFGTNNSAEAVDFMFVAPPVAVIAEAGQTSSSLLYRMKKGPGFADVPVIFLTATPDPALDDRVKRGELAAALVKPVRAEDLYRVIQSVVEKTPRRNIRIATSLPAVVDDGVSSRDEYVTVLSEHGLFFQTFEQRQINKVLPISFKVKGRTIKITAVVLYTTSLDEGPFKEPGMGMKFVSISSDDRMLIKEYILAEVHEDIAQKKGEEGIRWGD